MDNQFTPINGFPHYLVSPDGKVINSRGRIKVPKDDSRGYLKVDLYTDGKAKSKKIHRLVAEAYIPNPYNKPDINHKDGNKYNNNATNLEWVTKSENMRHAYDTGLAKPHASYGMQGHKNPNAGAKGRKVRIVETGETFKSVKDCAIAIDGSDRRVCDCLNGKMDSYKDYHFEAI